MINHTSLLLAAILGQTIVSDHDLDRYERQRERINKAPQGKEPKDRSKAKASRKARKRNK